MKKKKITMILVSIVVLCINTISLSKYKNSKNYNINATIAKSIVILDTDNKIEKQINKNNLPEDFNFSVKNYDGNKINEVETSYIIEIMESDEYFPISYKLYNSETNEEILIENGKSNKIKLKSKEKQIDKYKIVFDWCEKSNLSEKINLKLKVIAIQEKGDIVN